MSDGGIRCRSLTEDGLVDFYDYHGTWACWPKDGYDVACGLERQGFTRLAEQLYWRLLNGVNVRARRSSSSMAEVLASGKPWRRSTFRDREMGTGEAKLEELALDAAVPPARVPGAISPPAGGPNGTGSRDEISAQFGEEV